MQALSGIAKDLVKMSGKSMTKITAGQQELLLKLVAFLTGAKNTMKGIGYFLRSLLLANIGTVPSLIFLALMILLLIPCATLLLTNQLGKSSEPILLTQVFNKGWNVNMLSAACFGLFRAQDVWFEIALPLFLRGVLGWSYTFVGGFMACWIVFYGGVQSLTPQTVLAPLGCSPPIARHISIWTAILAITTVGIAFATHFILPTTRDIKEASDTGITLTVTIGLLIFAFVFAVNSSIHSYLILAYTNRDKVAMNVGFYYMANAGGRLSGTLLSGIFYQMYGLEVCLWASVVFLISSVVCCLFLGPVPTSFVVDRWGD